MNDKILNQLSKKYFPIKTFHIYFKPKLVNFYVKQKEKVIPIITFTIVARYKVSQTFLYPNNLLSLLCAADTGNLCSHSFPAFCDRNSILSPPLSLFSVTAIT